MKLQHGSGGGSRRSHAISWTVALAATFAVGCSTTPTVPTKVTWVVGQAAPTFDPQGPPDPVRAAIERLLSRGLVEEDSTGRIVPAAADSVTVSTDGLQYRFRLRSHLAFSDGSPCGSAAFREAFEAGINRLDHATYAWLFGAVQGMAKVLPGRPLPPLGIATPEPNTITLTLSRPDSLFLNKLAFAGGMVPWRPGSGDGWRDGIGDYAIVASSPTRLTLVKRGARIAGPDSVQIRFVPQASRVRALLRASAADLVWPVPPDLLDQTLPGVYRGRVRSARPARRLLLVLRPDLPPTKKPAARHALASALSRGELVASLGVAGEDLTVWLPGGPRFEFPKDDPEQVRDWLQRGKLGRSLHVVLAYSADGPQARVARGLQAEWAGNSLDVELRPFRQPQAGAEMLRRGGAQVLLLESQAALETAEAELAYLVQPMRGPVIGPFRTGWANREFDRWISGDPNAPPLDLGWAQQRLAEDHVVLPIANLPWLWVQRADAAGGFHPRYGPDPRGFARAPAVER